jgi:3-hydroxybutyryl-CoA dehydrogenase
VKLAIVCDEPLKDAFLSKRITGNTGLCFVSILQDIPADSTAIFDLLFDYDPERIALLKQLLPRPIFINSVTHTLSSIGEPFVRINAWPEFFKREITELAALPPQLAIAKDVLEKIGWPYIIAPDTVGLISARIVAAIVNEAYYALEENVSSRAEIDTAMKAGTHYPFGPFEWSRLVGLKKIYDLLLLIRSGEISGLLAQEALAGEIKKTQV